MSIPTEAIEAAARALVAYESERGCNCNDAACGNHTNPYRAAQITLTAAAPYIQAAALRDAAESFQGVMIGIGGRDPRTSGAAWLRARAATIEGKTK